MAICGGQYSQNQRCTPARQDLVWLLNAGAASGVGWTVGWPSLDKYGGLTAKDQASDENRSLHNEGSEGCLWPNIRNQEIKCRALLRQSRQSLVSCPLSDAVLPE